MSAPHVVISAVHELDEDPKAFWQDESVRDTLDGFEKGVWDDGWHMCTGEFKSSAAMEVLEVETSYHSKRGGYVAEIFLDGRGKSDLQEIAITGMEDILEEINFRFNRDFTLEAYYWYDGVDKPGGVQ